MGPHTAQELVSKYMSERLLVAPAAGRPRHLNLKLYRYGYHKSGYAEFVAHVQGPKKVGFAPKFGVARGVISSDRRVEITDVYIARKKTNLYSLRMRRALVLDRAFSSIVKR